MRLKGKLQEPISSDHQGCQGRAQRPRNSEEIDPVPGGHLEGWWDLADKNGERVYELQAVGFCCFGRLRIPHSILRQQLLDFPFRNPLNPVLVEPTGCHALSRSRGEHFTQARTFSEFLPGIGILTLLLQRLSVSSCSLGFLSHPGYCLP